jgi:hypothetical protein
LVLAAMAHPLDRLQMGQQAAIQFLIQSLPQAVGVVAVEIR